MQTVLAWFTHSLRHYAQFHGRASRAEYWWFFAVAFIIGNLLDAVGRQLPLAGQVLGTLWGLATLIPFLAVASRRLHDTGHSLWWVAPPWIGIGFMLAFAYMVRPYGGAVLAIIFVAFLLVSIVLTVRLVYFLCRPGEAGPNRYGERAPANPG